jgi:hypothetical protein
MPTPSSSAAKPSDDDDAVFSSGRKGLLIFLALILLLLLEVTVSHGSTTSSYLRLTAGSRSPPFSVSYGLGWHYLNSATKLDSAGAGAMLASIPAWVLSPAGVSTSLTSETAEKDLSFWDAFAAGLVTSQEGEDAYAYFNFFHGQRNGLILESGALDGLTFSVSRFFVFARGWRAVHVEGSPVSYAKLVTNRPESLNLHTALCNVSRTLHYAVNPLVPATSGFWEFIPSWIKDSHYKGNGVHVNITSMPLVPCRPLGPLLELYGVSHINLWVLDVEGAEEAVLSSVDFTRVTVDVIVAELDGGNIEKDERCHQLLLSAGFIFHKTIIRNRWYVRRGFVPSAA